MKTSLIIFDFDGTLADTTESILATYRMSIQALGADFRNNAQCQSTIGLPLKEGFRQLFLCLCGNRQGGPELVCD